MTEDVLGETFRWFGLVHPAPTSKQVHTQLGVHLEEFMEMLAEVEGTDRETKLLLSQLQLRLYTLSERLKAGDGLFTIPYPDLFLDSLCDQIVTAVGVAHAHGFDVVGAVGEVNRSNYSKFVDGAPVVDGNTKVVKGPGYTPPDLSPFLGEKSGE